MKRKNHRKPNARQLTLGVCTGALLIPAPAALAVGFRLPNQDPEAIARGNAFVATADNPSAIYYNPAGITQLEGSQLRVGGYFVTGGVEYSSPQGNAQVDDALQPVPQIYFVHSPKDSNLSFGLGIYSPYGLSVDWGRDTPFNTLAERGKVLYLCFNPVIAWQILPSLSVAAGPTINYSEGNFETGIGLTPMDMFSFKGDGMGHGFNAGIRWQPCDHFAAGVSYRFETKVDYDGTSTAYPYAPATSTGGPLIYPQYVVGGVSYRPTPNWNIEINVDWTDWERVNGLTFNGTSLGTLVVPLNLESSLMYEFGVTRQLGKGYFASVGYFYSENSIPDASFNPILPDADLHLGSIGFGHRGERWGWAVAYHFGYNAGRTVSGSPVSPVGQTADGEYQTFNQAFNLAVTFKF
ncbi:MAG: outer membrane protein transport protein [Verrucomicrobiales bacterium]|nr:outer membrane protein transport protein [Verrucomicrobiales bacterium]